MNAHFGLSTITQPGENEIRHHPPISVRFEVPYFTVSGIQVRYLKIVERSGYQGNVFFFFFFILVLGAHPLSHVALPWVRYITQSGDYQIRT